MNKIENIKKILHEQFGFGWNTAEDLVAKHDDIVDTKLSNGESEEDIALALENEWLNEGGNDE